MSTLTGKRISETYKGLLKTSDESILSETPNAITDGDGNSSGVFLDTGGNLKVNNTVEFGSLKDNGEDITIEKFVDEADGIENNDNDTSLPTSAAVKNYVDQTITAEDLDFSGNTGTGDVDLDSEVFEITGSNGITTTAENNTLDIDGSTLQTAINTNSSDIATNAADIATNTADISTNAGNIATNTADIATNASDIATNASAISTNQTNIANNTLSIATNAANISTNTANITTNAANIASNDTDISNLQADVAANTGNIATNTSNISGNTADIATNAGNISTNATNISTNATNISTNTTDIATNAGNISTNATDITSNTTAIGTNADDITDLQNDKVDKAGDTMTGSLGIGHAPSVELDVNGDARVHNTLAVNYDGVSFPRVFPPYNPTGEFNTEPTGRAGVVNSQDSLEWAFSAVSIGGLGADEYSNRSGLLHGSGNGYRLLLSNATEQTIFLNSNGNSFINQKLAIGHKTPTEKLDVQGNVKATNVRTEKVRPLQGDTVVKINQAVFFDTGNICNVGNDVGNTDIGATLHLRTDAPLTDQDVIALTKGGQGTGFASGIKQSAQGEYTLLLRDNLNSKSIKLSSNKNATSFIDNALIYLGGNTNNQNGAITISNRSWANGVRNALIQFNKSGTQSDTALEFLQGGLKKGSITYSSTGTSYNVTSDYRVKENVVAITDGIERLKQLKPSKFNFITDAEKVVDGFIAHEVQDVIPEAVTGEKDATEEYEVTPAEYDDYGNLVAEAVMGTRDAYQQIDQAKIVPLLTAALQEAVSKIEALEARIQTLENI